MSLKITFLIVKAALKSNLTQSIWYYLDSIYMVLLGTATQSTRQNSKSVDNKQKTSINTEYTTTNKF